jgi:hypothetical protein
MMYAQAVYAVDACVNPAATPARAVAEIAMPGCETMKVEPSCLAQCTFDNQSSAQPVPAAPPTPVEAVLVLPTSPENPALAQADVGLPVHSSGPAPPLKFCRFLL